MKFLPALMLMILPEPVLAASSPTDCALSVSQTGSRGYEPGDPGGTFISVIIEETAPRAAEDCTGTIAIRSLSGESITLRNGANVLEARFARSGEIVAIQGNRLLLTGSARRRLTENGRLAFAALDVLSGQFVPPGEYTADIAVTADGKVAASLTISLMVAPAVSLLTAGGSPTLSLGEVSDGGSARADLAYRANTPVTVTATSDNRGRLVHESGESLGTISYTARLDGAPLDLENPALMRLLPSHAANRISRLTVEVAPQKRAIAGTYRDTLTITFIAD